MRLTILALSLLFTRVPIPTNQVNNYFWIITRIALKRNTFILAYPSQHPMCEEWPLKILEGITIAPTPVGVYAGIPTSYWCHTHLWWWPATLKVHSVFLPPFQGGGPDESIGSMETLVNSNIRANFVNLLHVFSYIPIDSIITFG